MSLPLSAETVRDVVIVHGILDTSWTMRNLDRALTEAGFRTHVVNLVPNDGSAPLPTLAEQVHAKVHASVPTDLRFSLVGFSMGGLIARHYAQRIADPTRIDALVTIASPHRGTWLAWFLPLPGVQQMRPGSAFLRDLDADIADFQHIRWITIRTPIDLMIIPSTSSKLPWAENSTYPVLAHPLLVFDRRVIDRTVEALKNDQPASSDTLDDDR
ncbi:MAG: alpha/beta fold hydrolase [Chthoniobacterales bacterium]